MSFMCPGNNYNISPIPVHQASLLKKNRSNSNVNYIIIEYTYHVKQEFISLMDGHALILCTYSDS